MQRTSKNKAKSLEEKQQGSRKTYAKDAEREQTSENERKLEKN